MPSEEALHWATLLMNQRCKWADVPEQYRDEVGRLAVIDLVNPVPPMQNVTFEYREA